MPNDTERLDFLEANALRIITQNSGPDVRPQVSFCLARSARDSLWPDQSGLIWYPSLRALADAHLGADGQESEIARQWDEYFGEQREP